VRKQVVKLQTICNAQKQKPFPDKRQNSEIIKQIFDYRAIQIKPGSAWLFGISFWDLFVFWSLFIVIFPET
jgi:hypothetical protein